MSSNSSLFVGLLIVIILGVVYNQLWLSFIIGAVGLLVLMAPEKKEVKKKSPSVIIRPIKVQRKYKKGETIYPEKMEIIMNEKKAKKHEKGPEALGKLIGKSAKWLLKKLKED